MIDLPMGLGADLDGQEDRLPAVTGSRETASTDCRSIASVSVSSDDDEISRNGDKNIKNILNGASDRISEDLPPSGTDTSRLDSSPYQTASWKTQTSLYLRDLERQKEDLNQEMEMELALVQGELEAERKELEREQQIEQELHTHIAGLSQKLQAEKNKEKAKVESARQKMEEARIRLRASQRRFEDQPESAKEQLRERLQEEMETLDLAQRSFEDLEFQWLEKVSSLEEERETQSLRLNRDLTQSRRQQADRKERVRRLEEQTAQIKEQAQSESWRLTQRWEEALTAFSSEEGTVCSLGKLNSAGGRSGMFPNGNERMKQALDFVRKTGQVLAARPCCDLCGSTPCVLSLTQISASNAFLRDPSLYGNSFGTLPRRRPQCPRNKDSERPISLHEKGLTLAPVQLLSLVALHRSNSFGTRKHALSCPPPSPRNTTPPGPESEHGRQRAQTGGSVTLSRTASLRSNGCSLQTLAEMEKKLREAMEVRERLLQAREAQRKAAEEARKEDKVSNGERGIGDDQPQPAAVPVHSGKALSTQRAPIIQATFNLRSHVEASGHGVEACRHLTLTSRVCQGFLTKMGGRIKTWRKRWFVFDSVKRRLAYFAGKDETKLKGVIYFQAIEEVYFDHLRNAPKSPNPPLTFCLKTYDRLFYMVAPTDVSLRIWMEVILTAVEPHIPF
ncbi:pleckstrin homology-like domain family B member 3 isoform X2 [Carcharodon carcharias]|uniref:pleckstrin homology-like domain family B member 3 isoform X2 n=1 Tax=Carcharodon carcharias TaxID=13397 RepID=UPI001B7E6A16|nr:pleckstrin homology-like domain family B member 3 isoform X2 [Carcharodon carcharias]